MPRPAAPAAARLLRASTGLTVGALWSGLLAPWLQRSVPLLALATACGVLYRDVGLSGGLALGTCVGLAYVWHMRPMYAGLPFDDRIGRWLVSLRLMPPVTPMKGA